LSSIEQAPKGRQIKRFCRPFRGFGVLASSTQGLRPGLRSFAATRLIDSFTRNDVDARDYHDRGICSPG